MGELGIAFCMGAGVASLLTGLLVLLYPVLCTIADNARERRMQKQCELTAKLFDAALPKMPKEWHV